MKANIPEEIKTAADSKTHHISTVYIFNGIEDSYNNRMPHGAIQNRNSEARGIIGEQNAQPKILSAYLLALL